MSDGQALGDLPQPRALFCLDLGLPDGDGIELTRSLRAWSRVPIIVISARGREATKSRRSTRAPTTTSPNRSA